MPVAPSLRSPFRRKALMSLLFLSMLVALCDSEEALNYQTCYREIKGCEECKQCTNSVNKEECACAKPTGGQKVLCDDVCMKNEDNSYREKRSWRVLGITLFSISMITTAGIFAGSLVYWSKTDTTDPESKMSPAPKELAVIEAPPELATGGTAAEEGDSAWTTGTDKSSSVPGEEPEQDAQHIAHQLVKSTSIY